MTKAKAAATQAIEIDKSNCEAHAALGVVLMKYDWDWKSSDDEFRQSIECRNDYATAHYWYANLLSTIGRTEESIAEAKRARDLDPFSPLGEVNLARQYYYARRFDEALDLLKHARTNGDIKTRYTIGLVYLQKHQYREALMVFQNIYSEDKMVGSAAYGFTLAKIGRRREADQIISVLKTIDLQKPISSQEIAIIYVGLNKKNLAVDYLQKAFEEKSAGLISLKVDPLFDGLRKDRRFNELLANMKLA
jgi:tetratricopeptide (TPR) repeat protein